ncbi:putative phosphatidylinositol phosphate phosphatase [Cryptosporidium canis]|uniref:phosphoinositide 5-phosphatase n=1 Tax=Cryptosporidium canis TaxID=195482 RepID=A0ABQ8P208_9CRYT|nr:putative phosphatidylinositol phosphate phosphatase [Cryptosporidium canis]
MGCSKTKWKCVHSGECSREFYYRIHTFVGGLEISVEDADNSSVNSEAPLHCEEAISFPRLVILRPKGMSNLEHITSLRHISEYRRRRSLDRFAEIYRDLYSEPLSAETRQLYDFTSNCIYEILSRDDMPLLTELRGLYGPPELLNSENNIDGGIMGNVLEKDESGILVVNPWEPSATHWGSSPSSRNSVRMETDSYLPDSGLAPGGHHPGLETGLERISGSQYLDFSGFSAASIKALAIFGVLFVFEEPYLLISTRRDVSCVIYQNGSYKTINRVTKSLAIPLLSNSIESQLLNQGHLTSQSSERCSPRAAPVPHLGRPGQAQEDPPSARGRPEERSSSSREKIEWVNRVSSALQKLSSARPNKESFSLLGESGASWLSSSIANVSSGILNTVSTAISSSINMQQSTSPPPSTSNSPSNLASKEPPASSAESLAGAKDQSSPNLLEDLLVERRAHLERLIEGVTKMISSGGFFYSFDLDITHTLQRKFEKSWRDHSERVGAPGDNGESFSDMKNKAYIISGDSRFIWNRNISLPVLISGVDPRWITPLIQGYFCNQAIVISPEGPGYIKIGPDVLSLKMNLINSFTDLDESFSQANGSAVYERKCTCNDKNSVVCRHQFTCKMCYRDYVDSLTRYDIVLMSRRSWERGGTRFNARGIDENANVANFVESELQICINNSNHWFAFTQIRGSIPLFWEQTGVNSCAITCSDHDYSSHMFERHHTKLVDLYGEVFYVNLLGSSVHEQALSLGLKKEINYYNLNIEGKYGNLKYSEESETGLICDCKQASGGHRDEFCFCSCRAIPIVYTSFDYHQKVKSQGFESALNEFVSALARDLGGRVGYFHGVFPDPNAGSRPTSSPRKGPEPVSFANLLDLDDFEADVRHPETESGPEGELVIKMRQKGVLRTNCLDCLDRTNALQWYVAWTWFVDLILSISTCSLEKSTEYTERSSDVSQEAFVKSLLNSQLSHFGWFQLILGGQGADGSGEANILEIVNERNSGRRPVQRSLASSISNSLKTKVHSSLMSSPLTLSNPIIPSKIGKRDLETRNSPFQTVGYRDTGQKHVLVAKKSLEIRGGDSMSSSTSNNSHSPDADSELIGGLSTIDLDSLRSRYLHQSSRSSLSTFEVFRECLLNGMGVVTLKDSISLLWAENGDVISEHYTGAGSVFSGVIKNRKISLSTNFDHAVKSLRRLYHNAFEDSSRQQYIDCLLYRHPSNSNMLGQTDELFKDNMLKKLQESQSPGLDSLVADSEPEKLTIWVGSWNLGGQSLNVSLDSWIKTRLPRNASIVCLCVQEIVELSSVRVVFNHNDKNREATLEMLALQTLGPDKYIKLHSISLVGLFCVVFVRRSFHHFVKSVESNSIKLGLMGNTGNKGAVMIRMNIERYGSIVFTNVHLTSGEQNRDERSAQLKLILQSAVFNEIPSFKGFLGSGASLQDHDLVILAGDFNFRLEIPKQRVLSLIKDQNLDELLSFDQFVLEKKSENVISQLDEGRISFPPTYKYMRGEYSYDPSRTPSWCDRVFVLSKHSKPSRNTDPNTRRQPRPSGPECFRDYSVSILDYKSDERYLISDHHPVFAVISVKFL